MTSFSVMQRHAERLAKDGDGGDDIQQEQDDSGRGQKRQSAAQKKRKAELEVRYRHKARCPRSLRSKCALQMQSSQVTA